MVPAAQRLSRDELHRGRQQLLRRDHVARRLGRADASWMRTRGERIAGAGGRFPAAAAACRWLRGRHPPRPPARRRPGQQRLRGRPRELQPVDGGRAADPARGRGGADGARPGASSSAAPARPHRATCSASGSTSRTGRIRTIYTAMFYPAPKLAVPNWPPYDGNWPLPATIVPAPPAPAQPPSK